MIYNRIMIFGLPGSGKSTFAVHLAHQLNLPLYHLDKYFFVKNWIERDNEEFLSFQQKIINQSQWIIDGNALGSLEMRYARADLVLYFCSSRPLCFGRLIKRRFFKDKSIQDRAINCPENLRPRLIKYMWTFDKRIQPLLTKLHNSYPTTPFYKIRSSTDLEEIIQTFSNLSSAKKHNN